MIGLLNIEAESIGVLDILASKSINNKIKEKLLKIVQDLTNKYSEAFNSLDRIDNDVAIELYEQTQLISDILIDKLEKLLESKKLSGGDKKVIEDWYIATERFFNKLEDKATGFLSVVQEIQKDEQFHQLIDKFKHNLDENLSVNLQ